MIMNNQFFRNPHLPYLCKDCGSYRVGTPKLSEFYQTGNTISPLKYQQSPKIRTQTPIIRRTQTNRVESNTKQFIQDDSLFFKKSKQTQDSQDLIGKQIQKSQSNNHDKKYCTSRQGGNVQHVTVRFDDTTSSPEDIQSSLSSDGTHALKPQTQKQLRHHFQKRKKNSSKKQTISQLNISEINPREQSSSSDSQVEQLELNKAPTTLFKTTLRTAATNKSS